MFSGQFRSLRLESPGRERYDGSTDTALPLSAGQSCEVCVHFGKLFTESDVKKVFLAEDVYARNCPDHSPLFKWIKTNYEDRQARKRRAYLIRRHYHIDGIGLGRKANGIPWVAALDYKGRQGRSYQLLFQSSQAPVGMQGPPYLGVLDSKWIDFSSAKRWLEKCTTQHTSRCQSSSDLTHVSPAWLIDTKDNCLVSGETVAHFVALSYRWGPSTHQNIDSVIFEQIAVPGGLVKHAEHISPTVRDAMQVVRAIGERYLWVDAICLAPDDKTKLVEQLQLMGSIYASARLTIVALDGDATTGLKGTGAMPRSLENVFDWKNGAQILARYLPSLSALEVDASEYFRRGWTFQEYILSRRRLIFANQQIHWQCFGGSWHEDCPDCNDEHVESNLARYTRMPNIEAGWPDFEELNGLIIEYNARELSFPEDACPGITGLFTYIESAFKGGFLFGLPRENFDAALMWGCSFGRGMLNGPIYLGLQRRKPSGRTGHGLPNAALPSWSWVGWRGYPIVILRDEEQYLASDTTKSKGVTLASGVVTVPITQWFSHSSPVTDNKAIVTPHPVGSDATPSNPVSSFDANVWKRIKYVATEHGCEGKAIRNLPWGCNGEYVYEHINFPGKFYWQPLPRYSSGGETNSPSQLGNRYISCQTKRLWLAAVALPAIRFEVLCEVHLSLYDNLGRVCGWLQLPNDGEMSHFQRADIAERWRTFIPPLADEGTILNLFPADDELLELVAVCMCKYPQGGHESREVIYDDFYGVLWIKWVNGVAFRHGCGYVAKAMWDEHEPQMVDLVLG
ncbi:heterokaryon incompatibility protein-domain-containing protein [Paraphoma chrysanthemicola]|nr:heterokaryon incompatibility protein-domain-containing protein [Paraphoma chrysanthemicola]